MTRRWNSKSGNKNTKWHLLHVDAINGGSQLNNWQFNSIIALKLALTNADNYANNSILTGLQQSWRAY